ncbi:unnamed protein product [Zymoseptoria tritici ST99CH_1A5]|uniref:Zn(2)-C6 fungal-type domain-containing protein n=1 Tax=Zymoseptoria tritici ST99CH_1A5 TaxID=1276529 RepID=A0A1Y6LVY2_ZYMTR|nr:unnamed protein product [Zymoseptoria tritici ST99CH_1A5]
MSRPFSPTDIQQANGVDFEPPPITRRATIGDPVGDNAVARQRRKTTVTACDRCRRRKIRCDGERPCHTCNRFGVRCFTTEHRREGRERSVSSTADTAALADRVRQLEARLAASEQQSLSSNGNVFDSNHANQTGPPSLHIDTTFNYPDLMSDFLYTDDMSYDETPMTEDQVGLLVPTIQITGPHGTAPPSPSLLSPNSPSPSLFSGTSNASTPDMLATTSPSWAHFDTHSNSNSSAFPLLHPSPTHFDRTPPMSQWAEVYDQTAHLKAPGTHSRRSSISSFGGLPESFFGINLDCRNGSPSPQPDWSQTLTCQQQQQVPQSQSFDLSTCSAHQDFALSSPSLGPHSRVSAQSQPATPSSILPSKSEADFLLTNLFTTHPLPSSIEPTAIKICLEAVYNPSSASAHTLSTLTPFSPRMARLLVHLVLTIGYVVVGNEEGAEGCYGEVVEGLRERGVWREGGAGVLREMLGVLGEVGSGGA